MNLEGKKILVTGTSGLIGSNLLKRLITIPDVDILCNINDREWDVTGAKPARGSLLDPSHCESIATGIDVVFHCAAKSFGAAVMENDPMALVKDNIVMNINMLEACHKKDVKKFVWLASTTGYPNTDAAVTEDMMFDDEPFDKYYAVGWVKRYTEVLCKLFSEKLKKQLPCIVLRPTNIYGPNDKTDPQKSHVLPALMRKVIEHQDPIEVWGDGTDERDVLYVDDMVDAMIIAAEKVENFDQFNIGYGETYTVLQLLDMIKEIEGFDAPIEFIPSGPRMIPIRRVNIDKAKNILGWTPKTDIKNGLQKMHGWMKEKLSHE
jgi:GDP-L-fucose synthase